MILELERLYRINEDILRFIVVKYESKKEQKAWETLVDKAKNPAKYAKKPSKKEETPKVKEEVAETASKEEEQA